MYYSQGFGYRHDICLSLTCIRFNRPQNQQNNKACFVVFLEFYGVNTPPWPISSYPQDVLKAGLGKDDQWSTVIYFHHRDMIDICDLKNKRLVKCKCLGNDDF